MGEALYSVSEHFINPTSVSANHYYFNQFQLLLALCTDAMVIHHIFDKNSCLRIQLLFSVKGTLFYHPKFCLGYTVFFSLVHLLFIQHSFR